MKFRLKPHPTGLTHTPTAPHQHTDGHWYKEGEVLESPHDLRELFPEKFQRVRDETKVTVKKEAPPPMPEDPDAQDDEDLMVEEEAPEPAKAKVPAKPKTEAKVEDEAGDDVTDKFPLAKTNDLSVFHSKDGYSVRDGSRLLTKELLATPAKVREFLKETVEDDEKPAK